MEIKKLTQKSCDALASNLKVNFNNVVNYYHSHNSLEYNSICSDLSKINDFQYNIDDRFSLGGQINLKADEKGIYDFENAVTVYSMFNPQLTPFEANDERLWVRLTHDHCHKYMIKRWMSKEIKGEKVIQERFFFKGRSQSARVRNGISRLWWIANLTIQSEEELFDDKWKYTKAICESQDLITSLLERSIGSYENVRFAVLDFYLENSLYFSSERSNKIKKILRDLNNYGGVTLLSLLSIEDIKAILENFK